MNKKIVLALVAVLVIAIGGLFFPKGNTVVQQVLGSVASLDGVDNPNVSIGGLKEYWVTIPMAATSSVICLTTNPSGATSTIEVISAESKNVGIAQANNLFIATTSSTSKFATTSTTALAPGFAMGTGKWSYSFVKNVATSTDLINYAGVNVLEGMNSDSSSNYILGPGESVAFIIATSTPGTFVTYDQGACSVKLRKI